MDIPKLKTVAFYTTYKCNLKCYYCWFVNHRKTNKNNNYINKVIFEKFIKEAIKLGLSSILFTGGEPFLRNDIIDLLEIANKNNLLFSIETNGTLLNEEIIKNLKKYKNLYIVATSIDSCNEGLHDYQRGTKGSFSKSINTIEKLVENNINTQVIHSINNKNFFTWKDTVRFLYSKNVNSIKVNPIIDFSKKSKDNKNYYLTNKEIIKLKNELESLKKNDINFSTSFMSMPCAFSSLKKSLLSINSPCQILNKIGLLSDGNISICGIGNNNNELLAGNIFNNNLYSIWNKSSLFNSIRVSMNEEIDKKEACHVCLWKKVCTGYCKAKTYIERKHWNAAYPLCQEAYENGYFPRKNDLRYLF